MENGCSQQPLIKGRGFILFVMNYIQFLDTSELSTQTRIKLGYLLLFFSAWGLLYIGTSSLLTIHIYCLEIFAQLIATPNLVNDEFYKYL